ncbi:MAG: peptidylprolyl isomerase [Chitinophagaceae bacterium]|nr:peptidylprolyl isomerase [Chitinophagaceae bacterium]
MQNLRLRSNIAILAMLLCSNLPAQTLFTYGKHKVSKDEFIKAYNKNSVDTSGEKVSYQEYLDLYTRFKLKVQAALDEGMDTLPDQVNELKAFRYQLADNFMKEDASIKLLTDEAIERSKKDIHISVDDQDLGWITVFVLPYAIENIAYATHPGSISDTFRTSSGVHRLKVLAERKAIGEVRVAQILLAFRPGASEADRTKLSQRADSLYTALQQGADFVSLVEKYSDDNITYKTQGEMPAFGPGKYDPKFEAAAFALEKDGDISKPFASDFGYHILRRTERLPVKIDTNNIKQKVLTSDRIQWAQRVFVTKVKRTIAKDASAAELASDSAALDYYRNHLENYNSEFADQLNEFKQGNLLFAIMQKKVWDAGANDSVGLLNYYNANKDKYTWESSADALVVTVLNNISIDSLMSTLPPPPAGYSRQREIGSRWRQWVDNSNGYIQADSSRFELSQIPVIDRTNFTEGLITAPVINDQDNSRTSAYIIKLYKEKEPKKFEDARGAVINDYQQLLEEQWMAELEKKYPVKVNDKELNKL